MAKFNVEKFVALTVGLAAAGGIGAAVWTSMDEEPVDPTDAEPLEGNEARPEQPANGNEEPSPATQPSATGTEATSADDDAEAPGPAEEGERPEGDGVPYPATETPSWQ